MRTASQTSPSAAGSVAGPRVFMLRPAGEEHALLSALRERGVTAVNLAVLRIVGNAPADALNSFTAARSATRILFSSPGAVTHAHRIDTALSLGWFAAGGHLRRCAVTGGVLAPGRGTRAALATLGIAPVQIPTARFDSEGLLALPALAGPGSGPVAIVGAPGGRGLLETTLSKRGIAVIPVHVYVREDSPPDAARVQDLLAAERPVLVVSSANALARLWDILPAPAREKLGQRSLLVVAGNRLATQASAMGFAAISVAKSAHVAHLVAGVERVIGRRPDTSAKDDSVSMTP